MEGARVIASLEEAYEVLGEEEVTRAVLEEDWRRGDLGYRFSALQKRVRALTYDPGPRWCGWLASRQAGKSRTGVGLAVEKGMAYPGMYVPYAAPTKEQINSYITPHLEQIMNEAPADLAWDCPYKKWVSPPLQWYDAKGNPVRYWHEGGVELARFHGDKRREKVRQSIINPRGCDKIKEAERLRGPGTAFAVVDEARDIPILSIVLRSIIGPMLLSARARFGNDVIAKLLLITTAPEDPDHPFVDIWETILSRGTGIHSTVYDADHLTKEDIEELKVELGGEGTPAWRREALAIIERDPSLMMFPEFDAARHVVDFTPPEHFLPATIGDGAGVLNWYGHGYYNWELDTIDVYDESWFSKTRSDVQGDRVAQKEAKLWGDVEVERRRVDAPFQVRLDMNREEWGVVDDWVGGEDQEPPHWAPVSKPRGRRGEGGFRSGVNQLGIRFKRDRIRIHPRCEKLIQHLQGARWNRKRSEPVYVYDEKGDVEHHYDAAAGLVYFCRDVNRTRNPYPTPASKRPAGLPPKGDKDRDPMAGLTAGGRRRRGRRRR